MANKDRVVVVAQVQKRYEIMLPYLSERTKRAWAAAEALAIGRGGNAIVAEAVGLFDALGYSLQVNRKTEEGIDHPDRDAQFQFITDQSNGFKKSSNR